MPTWPNATGDPGGGEKPWKSCFFRIFQRCFLVDLLDDTVDGQNPAPPRMMLIPLFVGFLTIPGGAGFLPSTVLPPPKKGVKLILSPNNFDRYRS